MISPTSKPPANVVTLLAALGFVRPRLAIAKDSGLYLAVPKLSTIETSVVIDDSELLCHEQLVALDNFLDHFAFRIEPEIG